MPKREIVKSKPFYRKSLFFASLFFFVSFVVVLTFSVFLPIQAYRDSFLEYMEEDQAFSAELSNLQFQGFVQKMKSVWEISHIRKQPFEVWLKLGSGFSPRRKVLKIEFLNRNREVVDRDYYGPGKDYLRYSDIYDVIFRPLSDPIIEPVPPLEGEKRRQQVMDRVKALYEDFAVSFLLDAKESWSELHKRQFREVILPRLLISNLIILSLLGLSFAYVLRLIRKTQRLEAEAQIADRLAYVGSIASGLAHEIRNPLNAMAVNLQMLEEEIETTCPGNEGEVRSMVQGAMNEVSRLDFLVTQFLDYARPAKPALSVSDVNGVVADTLDFLQGDLETGRIEVSRHFSPRLPPIPIDSQQIRQALMNILLNAKQVLPDGGRIEVTTAAGSDGEVRISIADNGPGIPPGEREKIFRIFYSTKGGGTGMGLPIARKILENHGGSIEVETGPGGGTTFTLVLPRTRSKDGSRPHDLPVAGLARAGAKR